MGIGKKSRNKIEKKRIRSTFNRCQMIYDSKKNGIKTRLWFHIPKNKVSSTFIRLQKEYPRAFIFIYLFTSKGILYTQTQCFINQQSHDRAQDQHILVEEEKKRADESYFIDRNDGIKR